MGDRRHDPPGRDVPDPRLVPTGIEHREFHVLLVSHSRNAVEAGVKRWAAEAASVLFEVDELLAVEIPDDQGAIDRLENHSALTGQQLHSVGDVDDAVA